MKALTDHPDQREVWYGDFEAHTRTAVEEIVRWATPVIHFRRTATEDTELAGQPIAAGEKVVLWYTSANRDERVFADPFRFDVTRPITPDAGRVRRRRPALLPRRQPGPPRDLGDVRRAAPTPARPAHHRRAGLPESSFINGIKRLPCAWG